MPSRSTLVAALLGAGLAAAASVAAPASASTLGVDGGSLHHWVEPSTAPSPTLEQPAEPSNEKGAAGTDDISTETPGRDGDKTKSPTTPLSDPLSDPVPDPPGDPSGPVADAGQPDAGPGEAEQVDDPQH